MHNFLENEVFVVFKDNLNNMFLTSHNSGGMHGVDRQEYLNKTLLLFSDFFCLQQHFLLVSGGKEHKATSKLNTYFGNTHDMILNPAFKDNNLIGKGRGSGGLAITWTKYLTKYVTSPKSENYKIPAIKVNFPGAELMIVNLYFMLDMQNNNGDSNDLLFLLSEVERIIENAEFQMHF